MTLLTLAPSFDFDATAALASALSSAAASFSSLQTQGAAVVAGSCRRQRRRSSNGCNLQAFCGKERLTQLLPSPKMRRLPFSAATEAANSLVGLARSASQTVHAPKSYQARGGASARLLISDSKLALRSSRLLASL